MATARHGCSLPTIRFADSVCSRYRGTGDCIVARSLRPSIRSLSVGPCIPPARAPPTHRAADIDVGSYCPEVLNGYAHRHLSYCHKDDGQPVRCRCPWLELPPPIRNAPLLIHFPHEEKRDPAFPSAHRRPNKDVSLDGQAQVGEVRSCHDWRYQSASFARFCPALPLAALLKKRPH